MRRSLKLRHLFPLFLVMLCALPALADVPTPERELDRRQAEARSWRERFPNQSPPDLNVTPAPDGKSLMLDIACKGPCTYSYYLDGDRAPGDDDFLGKGAIDELGGGKRGERVVLESVTRETRLLKLYYVLYGVDHNTRFGPKRTEKKLYGCVFRRFHARQDDRGRTELREGSLNHRDASEQQKCNP